MGHSRIGILPASRQWNEVVRLIADGGDVPEVADSTLNAAGRAFAWVQKDPGFRETVHLMVELALAAGHGGGAGPLEAVGASVSESTSLAEVAMAVAEELDRRIDATRGRSDLAEKAQGALVGAICEHVQEGLPTLFEPTREDVAAALNTLKRPKEFGKLTRSFFAKLTNGALEYFLSRTLGTHLGEGQRFATNNQMAQFKAAMKTHCEEAAVLVEEFGADWFSKHRYEEKGNITRDSSEGFGWYAMQKMRAEFTARAKRDEH